MYILYTKPSGGMRHNAHNVNDDDFNTNDFDDDTE